MSKSQIPNPKSQENPKLQVSYPTRYRRLELGIWSFFGAWSLVLGILATGCSTTRKLETTPSSTLVWPPPPDPARIAYVRSFSRPTDLGVKQSPFTRIGHWITGSEKGNEPLAKPFGLALDENDNLCLTDTGANRVCYFDHIKMKWRSWTRIGSLRLMAPVALVKNQDTFYVADSALASVVVFNQDGKLLRRITNHLERPSGLAILGGQVYVTDTPRHCIVVFDSHGDFVREFGRRGLGPGEFNFPTHLAVDGQGNLLVTDSMNSRVQVLDNQGVAKGQIGKMGDSAGQFSRPKGVAVDPAGRVYVVDGLFDNVQIFDQAGRLLMPLGEAGSKPGEFWLPNGIAIRRDGEILVADSYNHRVQIFKYVGP
jgi:DNA-binding beta-propeller fold protein YncE